MILVTGAAGFIGYHVSKKLCEQGRTVVGIDAINEYYDPALKKARLKQLSAFDQFTFHQMDICRTEQLDELFSRYSISHVCHLAAQAGVRYSLSSPFAYEHSNGVGFLSVIECARHHQVENFVYASSSSVYGGNEKLPFSETDPVDTPVSLYAATKRSNELTAHCYHHLFDIPCSGLRFFTVYGPWGRPDMALFLFTKAILEDRPIDVYNNGDMIRNFTYVDDVVEGIVLTLDNPQPFEVYNIGNDRAERLMDFIECIESCLGKVAQKRMMPLQPGDVVATVADIEKIKALGYQPRTDISSGVPAFIEWYRNYYAV